MRLFAILVTLTTVCSVAAGNEPITPKEFFADQDKYLKMDVVTVKLLVKSTGGQKNRYLNSEKKFTDERNFTIFIPEVAMEKFVTAGIEKPEEYFKNKSIRVEGKIERPASTVTNDPPRITVTDPGKIKVDK